MAIKGLGTTEEGVEVAEAVEAVEAVEESSSSSFFLVLDIDPLW